MGDGEVSKSIETRLFIHGEFVESSDGKTFDLISSQNNDLLVKVSEASEEDTNRAVASAKAAQPAWSALSPKHRGSYFKTLATLIRKNNGEFARLEALSMGHPVSGYFHAQVAASTFDYYSEAGYDIQGTTSLNNPGYLSMTYRQPYGVAAVIIPWNVPMLFLAKKSAPALIVGNCVVVKSSEKAPLTSALLATLVKEAGFPPGVINVLSGHGHISGSVLSHHMDVRALTFTGSTRTGRLIQEASSKSNLKAISLELGGKSPAIVFEDADLDAATKGLVHSVQSNSGQTCMASTRIYVQDTAAERFITLFKEKMEAEVRSGDPLEKETNHGPLVDVTQFEKVKRYIDIGKHDGTIILGASPRTPSTGHFIPPTIFTHTPESSLIMKEEVFGPIVNINTFTLESEAITKSNDSEYGLYASVYTKNIDRAMRVSRALEAGTVAVNCTSPYTSVDTPFGGYKGSGVGREGMPFHSMEFFLETKSVHIKVDE